MEVLPGGEPATDVKAARRRQRGLTEDVACSACPPNPAPVEPVTEARRMALSRPGGAAALESSGTWTSTVQSIIPKLPELNMPFTDKMPKPHEFIAKRL